ncbi:MAG: UvrD-helicase domain-containing protein [Chitinispirillaceae bacterium]
MKNYPENIAISASAGTGKTYRLALRYIELLASGEHPETIVALTFSRAAANEIFDRVVTLITRWISDPGAFRKECRGTALERLTESDLRKILSQLLSSLHRLPVGTIDSFFINILSCFSIELGLPAGFSIIDDYQQDLVKNAVLSSVLHSFEVSQKDVSRLFEAYRLITMSAERKRVTDSFLHFVEKFHQVFIETGDVVWGDYIGDYPFRSTTDLISDISFVQKELRQLEATGDYSENFFNGIKPFLEEAQTFAGGKLSTDSFFKKVLENLDDLARGVCGIKGHGAKKKTLALSCDSARKLAGVAGFIVNRIFEQSLAKSRGVQNILREYDKRYSAVVRNSGMLTFDDVKWIMGRGGVDFTSECGGHDSRLYMDYRLDSKYNHWLIDEFQDTSRLQWAVISNLIDEVFQGSTGRKSFFYVGDIKQAIYGWRNGDARLFGEILDKYGRADYANPLKRECINRSWRSAPEIVNAVNAVLSREKLLSVPGIEPQHIGRWEWEKHETNLADRKGYVEYVEFEKVGRSCGVDPRQGCTYIESVIDEVKPFEKGLTVAVLVRSNKKGVEFYNGLKEKGIPVDLVGDESGIDSNAVRLICSLLTLADSPHDRLALKHVQMSSLAGFLNDKTAYEISLMLRERGFAQTVAFWVKRLKESAELTDFSLLRLQELEEKSRRFDVLGERPVSHWKKFIEEIPSSRANTGNAVKIMTVHKSKGLQFDMVFLPELRSKDSIVKTDLTSELLTSAAAKPWAFIPPLRDIAMLDSAVADSIAVLDCDKCYEALCVLYVAMTRAKYALYMMGNVPPKSSSSVQYETILRSALSGGGVGSRGKTIGDLRVDLMYTDGEPEWHLCHQSKTDVEVEGSWIEISGKPHITPSPRVADISPSQKELSHFPLSSFFADAGDKAAQVGNAVHELFAQVQDLRKADVKAITDRLRAGGLYPEETVGEAVALFESCCGDEGIAALLSLGKNHAVFNEKRLSAVIDGRMINGIVDRFVIELDENGSPVSAFIMDYKTNRVSTDSEIEEASRQYVPQLDVYRRMVAMLTGLEVETVRCGLLFVRPRRYVELAFEEMAAAG